MRCTCLIPFYNESQNIEEVLNKILEVEEIDEVLCVNDCSTDNTAEIIKSRFPKINLVERFENGGKSAAVRTGLNYINSELTLLFDADISDVDFDEINSAIKSMKKGVADMLILRRDYAPINHFFPADILICGERILPTNDLRRIFKEDFQGYAMEFEINNYYLKRNAKIMYMLCSTKNTHKTMKWGMIDGIKREIDVFYKILIRDYGILKYNLPKQYFEITNSRNYLHPLLHHLDTEDIKLLNEET